MNIKEFKHLLSKNTCPFCKKPLKYYSGLLGYEAMKCEHCGLTIDHTGMHLE